MADNGTAASGPTIAWDDIGGVAYQRVKPAIGADGTATDVSAGAGAVGAGVQRVTLASDDPAVTQIGGLTETAPASDTASSGLNGRLQRIAQRLTTMLTGIVLAAGTAIIGKVGIDQTTDGTTNKVNIDASLKSGTATRSTVNSGTSSVTILASNSSRKGGTIFNSDANALLLDLSGGTAAATRCQVRLTQYQTHEIANGHTGAITGIWEGDGSGIADVIENT